MVANEADTDVGLSGALGNLGAVWRPSKPPLVIDRAAIEPVID